MTLLEVAEQHAREVKNRCNITFREWKRDTVLATWLLLALLRGAPGEVKP